MRKSRFLGRFKKYDRKKKRIIVDQWTKVANILGHVYFTII